MGGRGTQPFDVHGSRLLGADLTVSLCVCVKSACSLPPATALPSLSVCAAAAWVFTLSRFGAFLFEKLTPAPVPNSAAGLPADQEVLISYWLLQNSTAYVGTATMCAWHCL